MSTSDSYWRKRFERLENISFEKTQEYMERLDEIRDSTLADIESSIKDFYMRFADVEGLSMAEAQRLLDSDELEAFHMTVERYIKLGIENATYHNEEIAKQLEEASLKYRVTRLQALKYELMAEVNYLMTNEYDLIKSCLAEVYIDRYYRSVFELFKGYGIGTTFSKIDQKTFEKLTEKPWTTDGKTFSERIWTDQVKLTNTLSQEMSRACITGESYEDTAIRVANTMKTTRSNAYRLVKTESAHFATEAQKAMYDEFDVDQFQFLATVDEKTCDECGPLDNEIYNFKDLEEGVNAPPMHPRCRCTTIPYFDDEDVPGYVVGTRTARSTTTGKTYFIPADMDWEEWIKKENIQISWFNRR